MTVLAAGASTRWLALNASRFLLATRNTVPVQMYVMQPTMAEGPRVMCHITNRCSTEVGICYIWFSSEPLVQPSLQTQHQLLLLMAVLVITHYPFLLVGRHCLESSSSSSFHIHAILLALLWIFNPYHGI
jgi:hypothetical protein